MACTGLFLVLFLLGHLMGNLQLLIGDVEVARLQFNEYAHFMTTNPAVKILSILTYSSILLHIVYSVILTIYNRKSRPVNYGYTKNRRNATLSSRNMGILGTFILLFVVIHMKQFWYEMHWGNIGQDANNNRDLYEVVRVAYEEWWYVAFYVISMVFLAYHLSHGFISSLQTLGFYHNKYKAVVVFAGKAFSIIIPFLFALIPTIMYIRYIR